MDATPHLHTYRCSLCLSTLTTSVRDSGRKCILCFRFMHYEFSVPVQTDEEWTIYRKGEVFSGGEASKVAELWTCVRCGGGFAGADRPRYRPDGRCCVACVKAEVPPLVVYHTAEQIQAEREQWDSDRRRDEERLAAAYRAAEASK